MTYNQNLLHHEVLTHESVIEPSDGTVVFAHGWLGNSSYWRPVAEAMAGQSQLELVALDLAGFGKSPRPSPGHYTPDDHAEAIKWTVEALDLAQPATAVGHSYGARALARCAVENPGIFERMVFFNPPLHTTEAEGRQLLRRAAGLHHWLMATKPGGRLLHSALFGTSIAQRQATRRFDAGVAAGVADLPFEPYAETMQSLIYDPGGLLKDTEQVHDSGTPVTLISAPNDPWASETGKAELRRLQDVKGLDVLNLPGDHHVPYFQPQRAASEIIRLIKGS
jgi:pimeloyl-ACP methyl ester carboxylesterase